MKRRIEKLLFALFIIVFSVLVGVFGADYGSNETIAEDGKERYFSMRLCSDYMPYYGLTNELISLRAKFYTTYTRSSDERKHNIRLASESLDKTIVDVGEEFSFNRRVGERTKKRGYKEAKIISNGSFVSGTGGGVCQVSTTLYNAVLLAGLKITEYHAHSLQVSYVAPSFDAMVNSGSADLRFVNQTKNPIIIRSFADKDTITIEIYGEKQPVKYERKSVIKSYIPSMEFVEIADEKGEYPDLSYGEKKTLYCGKDGIESEGYLVCRKNGKVIAETKIRNDKYKPTKGLIVVGRAEKLNLTKALTTVVNKKIYKKS